jgi:cytochrome c-type biogenesis protein CcmH/NrfG
MRFAQRFSRLPDMLRRLDGVALLLILTTAAFLATPSYHQIAAGGHAASRMLMRASKN